MNTILGQADKSRIIVSLVMNSKRRKVMMSYS